MDVKTIVGICAGLGIITTTLFKVHRWHYERSVAHRRGQELSRAQELVRFIELAPAMQRTGTNPALVTRLIDKAQKELESTLTNLEDAFDRPARVITPIAEVSFLRRWFLLYAPRGWRASIAHFLFYLLVSALFFFTLGVFEDDPEFDAVFRGPQIWLALVSFVWLALLARYWAVVERGWSTGVLQSPGRLARVFLWYQPVNGSELLARLLLFFCCYDLLLVGASVFNVQFVPFDISYPYWLIASARLLLAWSFIVAYFWSRAEARAFQSGTAYPRFPHNLRFLYPPSNVEEWAALVSFYAFACWTIVQLWRTASLPPGLFTMAPAEEQEAMFLGVTIGWFFSLCRSTLLPLYGAYLWGLAAYRSTTSQCSVHAAAP